MNMKIKQRFREAQEFGQGHSRLPGYLWAAGTAWWTVDVGYKSVDQIAAAGIDVISIAIAITASKTRWGYPVASALNVLSRTAWQGQSLLAADSLTPWIGYAFVLLSNAPVMAEPWLHQKAQRAAEAFKDAGEMLTARAVNKVKWATCSLFANPRPSWAICHTTSLGLFFLYDMSHGHYGTLPAYLAWFAGNGASALLRPTDRKLKVSSSVKPPSQDLV